MNPYQPPGGGYPNYPNNPYGQMPTPDYSYNIQQQNYPGSGYPGSGAPQYPGAGSGYPGSGAPQYPGAGSGYPGSGAPQYPGAGSGYPGSGAPQYPGAGGYSGYPSSDMPNYGNQGGYSNYGGNYTNPSPPNVPNYNQGGYPNAGYNAPFPSQNTNQVPPTPQYQPPQQTNPASNLFPNLVGSGGSSSASNYNTAGSYTQMYEGTVKPFQPFNPVDDAAKLYKAMKGFGTNETVLIDVLCRRTNQQRLQIASSFKTAYGKDLLKEVVSETGGDFQDLLRALLLPTVEFEAHELREALQGAGTDEAALIEIVCAKTNQQMLELRQTYKRLFNRDMEKEVRGDVSGYFQRILVSLINANRSDAPPDVNRARQLAQELHKAGEKRMGTDEATFNRIFASESLPQLKLVFEEYQRLTGHDIERAIKSEMSGDVERAFLAIAKYAKSPPGYFAERFHNSMKGAGTKDRTLIRNTVLRCEIDMRDIKVEFQRKYGKSLESYVKHDLSGDYERAVRCLIGDPNWK